MYETSLIDDAFGRKERVLIKVCTNKQTWIMTNRAIILLTKTKKSPSGFRFFFHDSPMMFVFAWRRVDIMQRFLMFLRSPK